MQVVSHLQDLSVAIARASSIAEKAFSDSSLYLEKWIDRPRHIEFQIIGDGKEVVFTLLIGSARFSAVIKS